MAIKPEPAARELPPIARRAMELALRSLSPRQVETTNLAVATAPVGKGTRLLAYRQAIPIEQDSIVVFADEMPGANWSHPCRYILCDARSGEPYTEIAARFPLEMRTPRIALHTFHEPIVLRPGLLWPMKPRPGCFKRVPKGRRYAILFSGASNARHVNDMEFLYRTLRDHYGMPDSDIICLNHDGTLNYNGNPKPIVAWPGDGTAYRMPIKGKGTKADLDAALDDIAARIKAEDSLLIHTNNHGGWGGWGKSYLCVQSGADYYAADFAAKLKTLPKFRCLVVMMEQCHAGGFNAPIIANSPAQYTSVASATVEDQSSWGNAEFDFFARDWIAAMAGHTPYGGALASNPDSNGDGTVSAREAYDYADSIQYSGDTPNWSQSSATARTCHLAQRYGWAWTWFCPFLIDLLYPVWQKLPIPDFYDRFRKGIAPVLDEFEATMEKDAAAARGALEKRLKEAIARTF